MPFGKARSSATTRAAPSGVTTATSPGLYRAVRWAGGEVKVGAVDVGVTASIDHDVVAAETRQGGQVGEGRQAAVLLKGEECLLLVGDECQPAVGQEVEAPR